MVTFSDTLVLKVIADATKATASVEKMSAAGKKLSQLQTSGININGAMEKISASTHTTTGRMKVLTQSFKQATVQANEMKNRFDMNTLSWMFGGMALQRVSLMMVRFLIPSMEKLEQLNTEGAKKVMGLAAAFEFLKISLFETLSNSPLFEQFIEFLISASIWISEFAQEHPKVVEMLAAIVGVGVVLGTLAIGIGIFKQLAHLGTLIGIGSTGGIIGAIKTIGLGLLALTLPEALIIGIALVTGAMIFLALKFEETRDMMAELWDLGFKDSANLILDAFGDMIGKDLEFEDILKGLAATGVWVFSLIASWANNLAAGVTFIVDVLTKIKDLIMTIGSLVKVAAFFPFAPEEGAAQFAKFKEREENLVDFNDMIERQKKFQENSLAINDFVWKGPVGIYEEAFAAQEELNMTMAETPSLMTEMETVQTDMINSMLNQLGTAEDSSTAIGAWNNFGSEIQQDTEYFNTLKTEMDDWAATETVKTFRIQYVFDGADSDVLNFTSRERVGSITGG